MEKTLFKRFSDLYFRLSPENLSCDGECTKSQMKSRYNKIVKEWKTLEKEAGRTVTIDEIEKAIFYICKSR